MREASGGLWSTGEAAQALAVSRDALLWAMRAGAPRPRMRVAGRRVFTAQDLEALRAWFGDRIAPGRRPRRDPDAL